MIENAAATLSWLAIASLGLGWYLGFHSGSSYVAFWLLCVSVGFTASRIVRRVFPWAGAADATLRVGTVAFALIVLTGVALGTAGLIGPPAFLSVAVAGWGASLVLKTPSRSPIVGATAVPIQIAVVLVPILAFVVAVGLVQSPLTLYDSLSYHLFFPARWLQEHRLSIIATPFSDEAQAYAPANGELFFLWLMVPFHGDLAARLGQLPFYLLSGVALYALARRVGAAPAHAIYAPAFFFLSRPIVEQAAGADVDLICWAMFLTSIYVGLVAVDTNARRDWILWGVSLGLYWGSKYVSLVYTPVFLLLPLLAGPRLETLWALPGILVFAMPWYVRNWVIAGSPIYPSSLTLAGQTIAQGAYSRSAMLLSVFHTTDLRLFPVMLSHAFGTNLFLVWIPFALVGAWSMRSARPKRSALFLLLTPVLMIPLFWFGVPDNVDSRFLLPAAVLALLPLGFVFRAGSRWNACVHAVFGAGLLWLIVGLHAALPVALPWYMSGWLSLDGMVGRRFVPVFVAFACVTAGVALVVSRRPKYGWPILTFLLAAGCAVLCMGSQPWSTNDDGAPLNLSPIFVRATMVDGWRWVAANTDHATIAYTGNNVPYPLVGEHLTNRVYYVNIDRHRDWRFHDYDRAHRRRRDDDAPVAALAASSGVLMPLPGPPRWHVDAVRPRYERMAGDRDGWIANLKALGVDRLFVTALSAYEIDYVSHDGGGFPVEDDWALKDPSAFTLLYENPQVKIYAVHAP
jgi:hypothetical protein